MSAFTNSSKKIDQLHNRDNLNLIMETSQAESHKRRLSSECFSSAHKNVLNLASQLQLLCNNKGIENEPAKSAEIIHKIGLEHFKMSPDKISLIKCVGLLNSAISRSPNNVSEIKNDLHKICLNILQQAKAKDQTADLLDQANHIKAQIQLMRIAANDALETTRELEQVLKTNVFDLMDQQTHKINSMKAIQEQIATQYTKIMINISKYCVDVMGSPPCKFAIVGMGSLARNEITPYSDFEHIVLLENQKNYEEHLEYFRWFSVIFHIIILNLQETIIPSLNVIHLNDPAVELGDCFFDTHTSGISFDGMMPHAATELIKSVNRMLEYLDSKDTFVNDYHLSDILMQTCFVYGDKSLHEEFENGIDLRKKYKSNEEMLEDIKIQVDEDMKVFGKRINLNKIKDNGTLNVKQLFYRTSTLMITAFGKIFYSKSLSCFDIINELAEKNKISENTKHKLSYAVAIACEIRLRVYMNAKSQQDYLQVCESEKTVLLKILKFVDKHSIVSYFQITYCLHREIMFLLNADYRYLYLEESQFNIYILYILGLDEMVLSLLLKYNLWES